MTSRARTQRIWKTVRAVMVKFSDDRCLTYAAALSFSSMLSVVPFLALLFAVLKALNVHTILEPVILQNISAGSHEIVTRIIRFINNTRVASMGFAGLATLVLSVVATLDTVEDAFNQIWSIPRAKALHHKLRDFVVVLVLFPLLIALATSITTSLQHQGVSQWLFHLPGFGPILLTLFRIVPYLSIWSALLCIYLIIPNTRVRFSNALIGAISAGTVWQLAQWGYIHLQVGMSRNNAVYGALSLLPVFMIWIYTSWIIVLAGMELVRYLQEHVAHPAPAKYSAPGF